MIPQCKKIKQLLTQVTVFLLISMQLSIGVCESNNVLTQAPGFYCSGGDCPAVPPQTLNNEYPYAVCAKEYHCSGEYTEKTVANRCGCCACNGFSVGCAGGKVVCGDGTLSQMCRCNYRLTE